MTTANGATVAVRTTDTASATTQTAYNLTVQATHTYHVGTQGLLVHNDCELPRLDRTGRAHGGVPSRVPPSATREELEDVAEELRTSIRQRKAEQLQLGEDGSHRDRIRQEAQLLRQIEKKLSGS